MNTVCNYLTISGLKTCPETEHLVSGCIIILEKIKIICIEKQPKDRQKTMIDYTEKAPAQRKEIREHPAFVYCLSTTVCTPLPCLVISFRLTQAQNISCI